MLSRNTEWRQGGILTHYSSCALGLFKNDVTDKCAVVISHDCDLPSEDEEMVEVIISKKVPAILSSYAAARHVRCLHLTYKIANTSDVICIELHRSGHRFIPKEDFVRLAEIESDLNFSPEEKRALKQWLAARYGRPAFPNEFENRLKKSKKLQEKLTKILQPADAYLIGLFIDLGGERSVELPEGTPYFLRIFLVYESIEGPVARKAAEECAEKIEEHFESIFGTPDLATELALESCQAVPDVNFSFADMRKVDQWWRHDYISLRESPTSPYLPIGVTSA